jgi:predicted metal-dependent RNase
MLASLNSEPRTFSAWTLSNEFTHPPQQTKGATRIGGIHKALMRAFADGKVIAFADAEGTVLREDEIKVPGSKAVGQPQIFGTPGAPSPREGFEPVTYAGLNHLGDAAMASGGGDAAQPAGSSTVEAESDAAGSSGDELAGTVRDVVPVEPDARNASPPARKLTVEQAQQAYDTFLRQPPAAAPDWVPLAALRLWAAAGATVNQLRRVVQDGPMIDRLALINAGLGRKGPVTAASPAARGIAQLCRRPGPFFADVVRGATKQYLDDGDGIDPPQLAEFAADPVSFYLTYESPAAMLLLCGLALDLDPQLLGDLAEVCDSEAGALSVDEDRFPAEERIAVLDSQLSDARKALRDAEKDLKAAAKREEALTEQLRQARETKRNSDGEALAAEQEARQAAQTALAAAQTELEELRSDAGRVDELEAEVAALQRSQDALLSEERSIAAERQLREEIEAQVQDQMRELGELRARLRADGATLLPTGDGPSLLRALARPVGEAAAQAAERMAQGRPSHGDDRLLAFAATVMQTSGAMQTDGPPLLTPAEPAAAEAEPETAKPAAAETVAETAQSTVDSAETADATDIAGDQETAGNAHAAGEDLSVQAPARRRRRRRAETWFAVRPVGGAGEIGGSAILVETPNHHRVLLDAGQRVKGEYGFESARLFHRGVRGIDYLHGILVSHAHIDHVGSLPPLWNYHSDQQDSEVPVWMTAPTKDLAEIMMLDSAKIQHAREYERDMLAETDFGVNMDPVYTERDVRDVVEATQTADAYKPVPVPGTSLVAQFAPVSHVLGSCAVHLRDTESGHTLLYTGDLGPITQPQLTLPDFGLDLIPEAETIVMESTYGVLKDSEREGRKRAGLEGREREVSVLFDNARQALNRDGFVLMPSFSLGRTQELVRLIGEHMGDAKIYIAGMGERIFEVYYRYQSKDNGFWARPGTYPAVDPIGRHMQGRSIEERVAQILDDQPGFIVASPAMLSGGWSRAFMEQMIADERHMIIFSGYLPRHGTDIPRLRELGKGRPLKIDGERQTISCDWLRVGLSAHAGAQDLRRFAREMADRSDHINIGLVHGEPQSQRELAVDIAALPNAEANVMSNGQPWTPQRP